MSVPETVFLFIAGLFSSVGERLLWLKEAAWFKTQEWSAQDGQRRRRQTKYIALGMLTCLMLGAGLAAWTYYRYYSRHVAALLASGHLSSRTGIYAGPRTLRTGQNLTRQDLEAMLQHAGYNPGGSPGGSFTTQGEAVTLHPLAGNDIAPEKVVFRFANSCLESINIDGLPWETYRLAPELLAVPETAEARPRLTANDLPPHLAQAFIAVSDPQFFKPRNGLRVFWRELWRDDAGLAQQLVNNSPLAPVNAWNERLATALSATVLQQRLTAAELLALYSNEVYLGQRGASALYGVVPAARAYFGKEPAQLTIGESALLACLAESPWRCAPDRHPEAALARRGAVLAAMLHNGALTQEQAAAAAREPLQLVAQPPAQSVFAPYFTDYANRMAEDGLAGNPQRGENSLRIQTTLDPDLQSFAETLLQRRLSPLGKEGGPVPQAALVALEVNTGRVVALVGGRNYAASPVNRATDVLRPAGAALSPVVYAGALEKGLPLTTPLNLAAGSLPAGNALSVLTLRDGLIEANEAATRAVANRTGAEQIRQIARQMQLLPAGESAPMDLQGVAGTPLALASAYTAFANGGQQATPEFISGVTGAHSQNVWEATRPPVAVVTPATAYMLTQLLQTIVQPAENASDTALPARAGNGPPVALAGQPGRAGDGWFIGYTPNLVCAIWVGFDGNDQAGVNEIVWPLWQDFMFEAVARNADWGGEKFAKPDNVRLFKVDLVTGLLANGYCEKTAEVALLPEQVPAEECRQHTKESLLASVEKAKTPLLLPPGALRHVFATSAAGPRSGSPAISPDATMPPPAGVTGPLPPPAPLAPSQPVAVTPNHVPAAASTPVAAPAPPLILPPAIIRTRPVAPKQK